MVLVIIGLGSDWKTPTGLARDFHGAPALTLNVKEVKDVEDMYDILNMSTSCYPHVC